MSTATADFRQIRHNFKEEPKCVTATNLNFLLPSFPDSYIMQIFNPLRVLNITELCHEMPKLKTNQNSY